MKFRTLTLQITYKCNAECDICVCNCNNKYNSRMNLDDAYRYIDEAFNIDTFENLAITGGEPFLFYDDLKKICSKAHEKNISITISTNGFWATNYEKAYEMMKELELLGVTSLYISVDEYHNKYVPYTRIKNIIDASYRLKMRLDIHAVVTKNSTKISDVIREIDIKATGIKFTQWSCSCCGRAESNIDEDEFIYLSKTPRTKCGGLNTLTIDPDGNTYPCCGVTNRSKHLIVPSAQKYSIEEIIELFNNNIYLKMFETYGTSWFLDNIDKFNLNVPIKEKYTSLCELCGDIFSNKIDIHIYDEAIVYEKQRLINKYGGK